MKKGTDRIAHVAAQIAKEQGDDEVTWKHRNAARIRLAARTQED